MVKKMDFVDEFMYLGMKFSKYGGQKAEVDNSLAGRKSGGTMKAPVNGKNLNVE